MKPSPAAVSPIFARYDAGASGASYAGKTMTFDEFLLANGENLLMETRDQAYRLAGAVRQFDCDGFVR